MVKGLKEELRAIAKLVEFNVPSYKRPDDFHQTKSDIVHRLRKAANSLEE